MTNEAILTKELSVRLTELLLDYPNDIISAMDEARKDEAIAFAEWLRTRAATSNNGCWEYEDNQDGFLRILTTIELYNEFKKQSK